MAKKNYESKLDQLAEGFTLGRPTETNPQENPQKPSEKQENPVIIPQTPVPREENGDETARRPQKRPACRPRRRAETKQLTLYLDAETYNTAKAASLLHGGNMNEMITAALKKYLDENRASIEQAARLLKYPLN